MEGFKCIEKVNLISVACGIKDRAVRQGLLGELTGTGMEEHLV